jgi:hypothetical protein
MTTIALAENTTNIPPSFIHDGKRIHKPIRRVLKIVKQEQTLSTQSLAPTLAPTTVPIIKNQESSDNESNEVHAPAPAPMITQITTDYCDPDLFEQKQIHRSITVPFHRISRTKNIVDVLNRELSSMLEGKCSIEGYICPGSIQIIKHSCGRLHGGNIIFDVDLKCLVCLPNEQTKISCVAKTITQAGIRAVAKGLESGSISPIEVFLSRDMNMNIKNAADIFNNVKEGDLLKVEIIGRRFVLNDTHVTIIAILQESYPCVSAKYTSSFAATVAVSIPTEKQNTKRKREKTRETHINILH